MPSGSVMIATKALRTWQEHDADERHDQALFDQRRPQRVDGAVDEVGRS